MQDFEDLKVRNIFDFCKHGPYVWGKTDPCVSELNWRGENVNDLGDELPEGAANCVENTAIRKTHER